MPKLPELRPSDRNNLLSWYMASARALPWRQNRDPYRIWISEVMLQQTTVQAVIPFYERFLERFPNVKTLAAAGENDVLRYWAGLGYYSRARNLHKAAQALHDGGFPRLSTELEKLPGFGPYTSRAVASIAFDAHVGVLDGNVIRVLTRFFGLHIKWWDPQPRKFLQELADKIADAPNSSQWNQAVMELGASICTPQKPACLLCPIRQNCAALAEGTVEELPLMRPRRAKEIWVWQPYVEKKGKKIFLVQNDYAPFLKKAWLPPGEVRREKLRPARFAFRHTITHHEIFVLAAKPLPEKCVQTGQWFALAQIPEVSPFSLVAKLLSTRDA